MLAAMKADCQLIKASAGMSTRSQLFCLLNLHQVNLSARHILLCLNMSIVGSKCRFIVWSSLHIFSFALCWFFGKCVELHELIMSVIQSSI